MSGQNGLSAADEIAKAIVDQSRLGQNEKKFSLYCDEEGGGVEISTVKVTGGFAVAVLTRNERTIFPMKRAEEAVAVFVNTARIMRYEYNKKASPRGNFGPMKFVNGCIGLQSLRETVFATIELEQVTKGNTANVEMTITRLIKNPPAYTISELEEVN